MSVCSHEHEPNKFTHGKRPEKQEYIDKRLVEVTINGIKLHLVLLLKNGNPINQLDNAIEMISRAGFNMRIMTEDEHTSFMTSRLLLPALVAESASGERTKKFNEFNEEYGGRLAQAYRDIDVGSVLNSLLKQSKYVDLATFLEKLQVIALSSLENIDPNYFTAQVVATRLTGELCPEEVLTTLRYTFGSTLADVFHENRRILLEVLRLALCGGYLQSEIEEESEDKYEFNVNDFYLPSERFIKFLQVVKTKTNETRQALYDFLCSLRRGPNGFVADLNGSCARGHNLEQSQRILVSPESIREEAAKQQLVRFSEINKLFHVLSVLSNSGVDSYLVAGDLILFTLGKSYGCPLKPSVDRNMDPFWEIADVLVKAMIVWYLYSTNQEQ